MVQVATGLGRAWRRDELAGGTRGDKKGRRVISGLIGCRIRISIVARSMREGDERSRGEQRKVLI